MKKPAIPDDYPTDNVLFEDDDDDQTETEDTKQSDKTADSTGDNPGETEFEIATLVNSKSIAISANVETVDRSVQYEKPHFSLDFDVSFDGCSENSIGHSIDEVIKKNCKHFDVGTQTPKVYNTPENPIVID